MTSRRDYPEQLPSEPDASYAHFRAWIDFDARGRDGDTAAFAQMQGIRPDYVRRLRSLHNWVERCREVETFDALTNRLAAEKAAEKAAEGIAAMKVENAARCVELERRVLAKAHEAIEQLDVTELSPSVLPRFVLGAIRAVGGPGEAASSSVSESERPAVGSPEEMNSRMAEIAEEFKRRGLLSDVAD